MSFFLWFTYIAQCDWLKRSGITPRGVMVALLPFHVTQRAADLTYLNWLFPVNSVGIG